jgi:hypothetical protein
MLEALHLSPARIGQHARRAEAAMDDTSAVELRQDAAQANSNLEEGCPIERAGPEQARE